MKYVFVVIAFLALSGCATLHRGVVAMKVSDDTAHVGLNRSEVSKGDHVQLFGNQCSGGGRGDVRVCKKIPKGHGEVVEIIGNDYASVKFDEGVKFETGDFVEKHPH